MKSHRVFLPVAGAVLMGLMGLAAMVLEFSEPITLSVQDPDFNFAAKPKIVRLPGGRLVLAYNDAVENDAGRYTYDAKADEMRPALDVFVRYCESKTADCAQEGNWSAPVNVSNTALLSSIDTDWDGKLDGDTTRKPYMGDSQKAALFSAGNRLVLNWVDAYCPDGDPVTVGLEPTLQRTVTYSSRHDREVPFHCLWSAWSANGGQTWAAAEQLSSGIRDAKQDVSRGLGSGHWAIIWQEDPFGLALGLAEGPGDGASGAKVSNGTDLWYSYAMPAWADPDATDSLGIWSVPVRLTDNFTQPASHGGEAELVRDAQGVMVLPEQIEGGTAGASRPNLVVVDDSERSGQRIAMVAYEETKGSLGEDEGKFVRLHTFPWNQAAAADHAGCVISDPMENSRRVRIVTQKGLGKAGGLRMAIFWRQGQIPEGGPADIMLRLGYASPADTAVTGLARGELYPPVDDGCVSSDYATVIALQNAPGLNVSSGTGATAVGRLADATDTYPMESARAHRAVLRGDDLYLAYAYTVDSYVAQVTNLANYNFWLRHYNDADKTWTEAMNLSQVTNVSIDVREPRLVGMPGNGPDCADPSAPADPADCQDKATLVAAWGTTKNVYEHLGGAVDYEIYYRISRDKARSFSEATAVPGRNGNPRLESQIRTTPDGRQIFSTWTEQTADGTDSNFAVGGEVPAGADLALSATVTADKVQKGSTTRVNMQLRNDGPQVAEEVVATVALSQGLALSGIPDCPFANQVMTCAVSALVAGSGRQFGLDVKGMEAGQQSLSFEVQSATDDPVAADNAVSIAVAVVADPSIEDTSVSGGGCVAGGDRPFDPMLPLLVLMALLLGTGRTDERYEHARRTE